MITMALFSAVLLSTSLTLERVVAVVGSEPVLHSDVISLMMESGIDQEIAYTSDSSSPSYMLAVDQMIEDKLLVEAAIREGLYPTRQEIQDAVDNSMDEIRGSFSSEQEFMNYLVSMGMTIISLRESYTAMMGDKIASENYVRLKAGTAMTSMPANAVTFFEENQDVVDEVLAPTNVSWIYLPVLPSGVNTDEAQDLLTEVRTRIENGELTFSSAAAEYSQDGSATSGGDLGWFSRGDMTATFEGVAYSLEPGDIAGPFLTPFGVHLIKLTDKDELRVRASHIIIVAPLVPEDIDTALQQADEIINHLNSGLDFAQAANQFSYDPDPGNVDGFLGTVNVAAWQGDMGNAVLSLNPGEISEPVIVEQNMAVAIFKSEENQMINWADFSSEELDSMLQSVYWQNYYSGLIETLKEDIPIVVNI